MEFSTFGLNAGIIAGIVGITQVVKALDRGNKYKRFYVFVPLVLGMAAGIAMTNPLTMGGAFTSGISYAGVAAIAYKTAKAVAKK